MAEKIKIYVDQNVISSFYGKSVDLLVPDTCQIVCSPALFDDIRESKQPDLHIYTLEALSACLVRFEGGLSEPRFYYNKSLHELFEENERWRIERLLDKFSTNKIRAMASSGHGIAASKVEWREYVEAHTKRVSEGESPAHLHIAGYEMLDALFGCIFNRLEQNEEVEPGKSLPGVVNSDDYTPPDALRKLWEDTADTSLHPSPEAYFGFTSGKSLLIAFDECCSLFDRFQFLAESKRKDPNKQPNVQNDAAHLAYATTCDFLVSSDRKLIKRAEVIYSHFSFKCKPVWLNPIDPITTATLEDVIKNYSGRSHE